MFTYDKIEEQDWDKTERVHLGVWFEEFNGHKAKYFWSYMRSYSIMLRTKFLTQQFMVLIGTNVKHYFLENRDSNILRFIKKLHLKTTNSPRVIHKVKLSHPAPSWTS